MTNLAIEEKINQPAYYHREYENDVKDLPTTNPFLQNAQRIGIIALPFLSLYKPLGSVISTGMNTSRSISCLFQTKNAIAKGDAKDIGIALFQTGIAIATIAGAVFSSIYGMTITSTHDVLISLYEMLQFLQNGEHEKALEKFIQVVNNSLYLTMILYGSLEIMILSFTAQILLEAFKSQSVFRKFKNNKNIIDLLEGFAHLGMAGIRGYQMKPSLKILKFKREITKVIKEHEVQQNQITQQPKQIATIPCNTLKENEKKSNTIQTLPQQSPSLKSIKSSANYDSELLDIMVKYGNNSEGLPVLHYAITQKDEKAVLLLLQHGANANARINNHTSSQSGEPLTSLDFAAAYGNIKIIKLLIDYGAEINVLDNSERPSPLHFAAMHNQTEAIKILIDKGADIYYETLCRINIADKIDSASGTPFHFAAATGNVESIKIFLDLGINVDYVRKKNYGYDTPLCYAIYSNNLDSVNLLLKYGSNVNYKRAYHSSLPGGYCYTPILFSVFDYWQENQGTDFAVFWALVNNGMDLNAKDSMGTTLLMNLVSSGRIRLECIKVLLMAGANVNEEFISTGMIRGSVEKVAIKF